MLQVIYSTYYPSLLSLSFLYSVLYYLHSFAAYLCRSPEVAVPYQ